MMNLRKFIQSLGFALIFSATPAKAEDFTEALRASLQQRLESEKVNAGIVIGLVDERGSKIITYGKLDNGTDQEIDANTLFEIGSDTKTFTALLLQDMIQRGEMNLDDPVSQYLPATAQMPTRPGRQITLRQLATHTSGLPVIPDNLDPRDAAHPYADYTFEKLYAFLSRHRLTRLPGTKAVYSNLGMGLLGHVIALKSGTDYESLVVERICRPLKMDSTHSTLTPELRSRLAVGHDIFGEPLSAWETPVLSGAGALRSTANDLLKYVSANLGLPASSLTPLMKQTQEHGLAWFVDSEKPGTKIISHGGGTGGCQSFVGFEVKGRRGVVILLNSRRIIDVERLGKTLLRSDWEAAGQPAELKLALQGPKLLQPPVVVRLEPKLLDAIVGDYEFAPSADQPLFTGLKLIIRREADQLIGRTSGENALQGPFPIYPESATHFLIKVNGARLTFLKNDQGDVTAVIHRETGTPDLKGKKMPPTAQ